MERMPEAPPSCVLIDDHDALRGSFRLGLELAGAATVIAEASNGAQALACLVEHAPDVALVDLRLGDGIDGIGVIAGARERGVASRLILLTAHGDPRLASVAFAAGADGYVVKDSAMSVIRDAIAEVLAGKRYLDPALRAVVERGAGGEALPRQRGRLAW